jgi:5-oxoprolinase (ATP-hydrolysing)
LVKNPGLNDIKGTTGEYIQIVQPINLIKLEQQLLKLPPSVKSVAICLMHSYTFQEHEMLLGQLCEKLGFDHISISCKTSPMIKIVPRGTSTSADSYLTPCIC